MGEVFCEDNVKHSCAAFATPNASFFHGYDKFGCKYNAGRIDMRGRSERALDKLLADETTFNHNLSYKCFKKNYGDACRSDRQFESEEVWEWKRRVLNEGTDRYFLCNPEDIKKQRVDTTTRRFATLATSQSATSVGDMYAATKRYRRRWRTTIFRVMCIDFW